MPLELPEDGFDGGRSREDASKIGDAEGYAHNSGNENTDEQRASDPLDQQRGREHNAEDAQQYSRIVHVAKSDEGSLGGGNNACTLKTYEGDEQADARTDGTTQHQRNGIDDVLSQTGDSEQDEDDTLDEYCREGKLPTVAHGKHHSVGKESIEAHTRSQSER